MTRPKWVGFAFLQFGILWGWLESSESAPW